MMSLDLTHRFLSMPCKDGNSMQGKHESGENRGWGVEILRHLKTPKSSLSTVGVFRKNVYLGGGVKKFVVKIEEQKTNKKRRLGGERLGSGVSELSLQMLQDVLCEQPRISLNIVLSISR
jgi:hypothetical protein